MEYVIFALALVLAIYLTIKNVKLVGEIKANKKIGPMAAHLYDDPQSALEQIDAYLKTCNKPNFYTKAQILKLYALLKLNQPVKEFFKDFDLTNLVYQNGKLKPKNITLFFQDAFFRLATCIIKANNNQETLESLEKVLKPHQEALSKYLEYDFLMALIKVFLYKSDDLQIFKDLLDGGYHRYTYGRNLIILYQRLAGLILEAKNQPIDEFYRADQDKFKGSPMGQELYADLGIK